MREHIFKIIKTTDNDHDIYELVYNLKNGLVNNIKIFNKVNLMNNEHLNLFGSDDLSELVGGFLGITMLDPED